VGGNDPTHGQNRVASAPCLYGKTRHHPACHAARALRNFRSASKRVFSLRSDQRGGLLLVEESLRDAPGQFISAVVFQKLTSAQTSTGPVKVDRNSKITAM